MQRGVRGKSRPLTLPLNGALHSTISTVFTNYIAELSQSGVISDFHIKRSTRWRTGGVCREIHVTLVTGAFILIWKGKEKDGGLCPGTFHHSSHPQVLLGTQLYVASLRQPGFGIQDEFESERK